MILKYLNSLKNDLLNVRNTKAMSILEVDIIEKEYNLKIPLAYKEFLLIIGKDSGQLFEQGELDIGDFGNLKQMALEEIQESNLSIILKPTDLVIYEHQGYIYRYLPTDEGNNPPVIEFNDGGELYEYPTVQDYISKSLEDYFKFWDRDGNWIANKKLI